MTRLRELLPGHPMPSLRVLIYTVAAALVTVVARPDFYGTHDNPLLESYSIVSMDLAMSRAFCDVPSAVTALVSVTTEASNQLELLDVPARQIAAERAGSLQRFCDTSTLPRINNENSLMWLDSWLWRLRPEMSINGLGQLLHGIRVAMLVATFASLLANGSGVIVAAISWYWALDLLQQLGGYVHHGYPFMLTMLLMTASACSVVSRCGWTQSLRGAAAVAAITGVWTGFATNMRTSHFPIYVSLTILLFASGEFSYRSPSRLRRLTMAAAMFVAGFFAFQYVAITRHFPRDVDALARHTIFHSVVIGLGVPESDLSRREELTWSDAAGYAAARRVDPKTGYLTQSYETALFKYYSGLWSRYPREMVHVYWTKACTAGKHMLEILRSRLGRTGRLLRIVLAPMDLLPNGVWIAFMYVAVAAGGLWRFWCARSVLGGLLAFMAIPAILLQLEATVVMSAYVINYQAYLAFFCVFVSLVIPAAIVGMLWDRWALRLSA